MEEAEKEYKITYDLNPYSLSLNPDFLSRNPSFDFISIWDFNEGKGDITKDTSGMYNNGEIKNAKWTKGPSEYALEFNDANSVVIIPDSENFHLDGKDFTIAIKFTSMLPQNKRCFIYTKGWNSFWLNNVKNRWVFHLKDSKRRNLVISQPIENKWYFAILRVAQGREQKILLFDEKGLVKTAERKIGQTTGSDGNDLLIGQRILSKVNKTYFEGKIAEVIVFNRALSNNEILRLYENLSISQI